MWKINTQDVKYSRRQKGVYLILKRRGIVKSILMLKSQVNNETNDWDGQTQRVLYDYKEFHNGGSVHICSSNMLSLRMHHKARAALPDSGLNCSVVRFHRHSFILFLKPWQRRRQINSSLLKKLLIEREQTDWSKNPDENAQLKNWLNPGLNLTVFQAAGPKDLIPGRQG